MKRQRAVKGALCREDLRERWKEREGGRGRERGRTSVIFLHLFKISIPCVLIRKDVFTRHALLEVVFPTTLERNRILAEITPARIFSTRVIRLWKIPRRNTPLSESKFRARDCLENESTRIYERSEKKLTTSASASFHGGIES